MTPQAVQVKHKPSPASRDVKTRITYETRSCIISFIPHYLNNEPVMELKIPTTVAWVDTQSGNPEKATKWTLVWNILSKIPFLNVLLGRRDWKVNWKASFSGEDESHCQAAHYILIFLVYKIKKFGNRGKGYGVTRNIRSYPLGTLTIHSKCYDNLACSCGNRLIWTQDGPIITSTRCCPAVCGAKCTKMLTVNTHVRGWPTMLLLLLLLLLLERLQSLLLLSSTARPSLFFIIKVE